MTLQVTSAGPPSPDQGNWDTANDHDPGMHTNDFKVMMHLSREYLSLFRVISLDVGLWHFQYYATINVEKPYRGM